MLAVVYNHLEQHRHESVPPAQCAGPVLAPTTQTDTITPPYYIEFGKASIARVGHYHTTLI